MKDGIARSDVRQEGVSKTLAFSGSLDETGNVHNVKERRHFAILIITTYKCKYNLNNHKCIQFVA